MVIQKYKILLDNDGYVSDFYTVEENWDYEGQLSTIPELCEGWYLFRDGTFVTDQSKKDEILAERQKQARIQELKGYLADTDYIYAKCTETGEDVNVVYADVIENRKAWRKEIQELEG